MSQTRLKQKAIKAIHDQGLLLVYPLNNRPEPKSLWSQLHPRTVMRWEWDDEADSKVAQLWHLREELSRSGEVVYCKWYQGRATFFSPPVWQALYRLSQENKSALTREAREILEVLEMDSPQSTRAIKEAVGLQGKLLESTYEKAMRELWRKFLIVGFGEVEDSSFPSLAVGASQRIFEEWALQSQKISLSKCQTSLEKFLPVKSAWRKFWDKTHPSSKR